MYMEEESIISLTFDFINSLTVTIYFQNPIKDFALPIRNLRTWFPKESAKNKRAEIAGVIRELAAKQHPKKTFDFPELIFTPQSGSGYTDDEVWRIQAAFHYTPFSLKRKRIPKNLKRFG